MCNIKVYIEVVKTKTNGGFGSERNQDLHFCLSETFFVKGELCMSWIKYIAKKIITILVIMLIVSAFVFMALRLSKADPLTVCIGNSRSTEQLRQQYTTEYHLDQPVFKQYMIWLKGVFTGDLGTDWVTKQDIGLQITQRIPVTIGLVVFSTIIGTLLAILLGVFSARMRGTWVDSVISVFMLIVSSVPSFLLGIIVIILFAQFVPGYSFIGTFSNFGEYIQRLMIPSIVMALSLVALLGRVTRSSMIQQFQSSYITTAEAKGIGRKSIIYKHAFHNGVIPVLTVAGYMFAASIGSTVLVETIFSLPGIGGLLITAIQQNNFPVTQVLVLIMLAAYMIMSFVVDVLYTVIDPRVSLQ